MPPPPNLNEALNAVAACGLPDHYRLVLISLIRHQSRTKTSPWWGLAWPSPKRIAGDTSSVTPEQAAMALQHMAHAGILRPHGTTTNGVVRWELRIEQMGSTDPLLQTMLSTRLRTVDGLGAATRHVLHELALLASIDLQVSASFSAIKAGLPWLARRAWRRAINQLTSAGVLREIRRGNRFHATKWQLLIPQPAGSGTKTAQLQPGSGTHGGQLSSGTQKGQLEPCSGTQKGQLEPGSGTKTSPLQPLRPYGNNTKEQAHTPLPRERERGEDELGPTRSTKTDRPHFADPATQSLFEKGLLIQDTLERMHGMGRATADELATWNRWRDSQLERQ